MWRVWCIVCNVDILAGLQGVSPGKSMDDEADVTLQTDMLHTLAAVCDEDIHRKVQAEYQTNNH